MRQQHLGPIPKARKERNAANEAADFLAERLGPDLQRLVALLQRASFRFIPALLKRLPGRNFGRRSG